MKNQQILVEINLPVEKHIYKYLDNKVGRGFVVSKTDFFGSILLDILSKKNSRELTFVGREGFPVFITEDYMYRYGVTLEESKKLKMNLYANRMFRMELMAHVRICRRKKSNTIIGAINDFLALYEITEDDLKLETLLKYVKRNLN